MNSLSIGFGKLSISLLGDLSNDLIGLKLSKLFTDPLTLLRTGFLPGRENCHLQDLKFALKLWGDRHDGCELCQVPDLRTTGAAHKGLRIQGII